jgi:hypothetical protein
MGVRQATASSTTVTNPLPATNAETVICTLPPINFSPDNALIFISWFANILAGTGTTSLTFRIRRGITALGASIGVNTWTHTLAAAASACMSGWYPDVPGAVGGQQYVLTCIQNAVTGAGTVQDIAMMAFVL